MDVILKSAAEAGIGQENITSNKTQDDMIVDQRSAMLPVPFFEGSEKRVEIQYVGTDTSFGDTRGLRQVPRSTWARLLSNAGITIESEINGEHWDCYMLSESSLFVSRTRVICKTCGQSAPLAILEEALQLGTELGYEAKQVLFSRSDLLRPSEQPPVHQSFEAECGFLDQAMPHAVSTNAYTLGGSGVAQWNVYQAALPTTVPDVEAKAEAVPPTLEIVCYGLAPTSSSVWWSDIDSTPENARSESGLSMVMPNDGTVDEMLFSPCGYSMNCFDQAGKHSTVHVTPQEGCSFASFEATVFDLSTVNDTVRNVLEIFKPERFSVSLVEWGVPRDQASSIDLTDDSMFASQYKLSSESVADLTTEHSGGRHRFSCFEHVETEVTQIQAWGIPQAQHGFKTSKYMTSDSVGDIIPNLINHKHCE
jgi:S-adenosylmethionine decarboxylase